MCEGTARPRDRGLEESRIVPLGDDVLHVLESFNFNICCIRVKFKLLNFCWIVGYILTGPDPDTLPGFPGWSRLVEFHCTIPRECTKGPHLKEK